MSETPQRIGDGDKVALAAIAEITGQTLEGAIEMFCTISESAPGRGEVSTQDIARRSTGYAPVSGWLPRSRATNVTSTSARCAP